MLDDISEVFSAVIETVDKHPYESAAVVTAVSMFFAGYGKGHRDGIEYERTNRKGHRDEIGYDRTNNPIQLAE